MTTAAVARRRGPELEIALAGTLGLHAALVILLFLLHQRPDPLPSTTYRVNLVAAPAVPPARRVATEAVAQPTPRTAPTRPQTTRRTTPAPTQRAAPQTEAAPKVANPVEPLPGETPSTGRNIANVKIEGIPFPFPEYLENITEQIYRRWSRPALTNTALSAEVAFNIHRDGTVTGLTVVVSSRNYSFDLEAMGAVEAAANTRAFGPLPEGFIGDMLPVSFFFSPRGNR